MHIPFLKTFVLVGLAYDAVASAVLPGELQERNYGAAQTITKWATKCVTTTKWATKWATKRVTTTKCSTKTIVKTTTKCSTKTIVKTTTKYTKTVTKSTTKWSKTTKVTVSAKPVTIIKVVTASPSTVTVPTTVVDVTTIPTTVTETTTTPTTVTETTTIPTTVTETTTIPTTVTETTTIPTTVTETTTTTATPPASTPDTTCGNQGLEFIFQNHNFINSDYPKYTSFDVEFFKTAEIKGSGVTPKIGIPPNPGSQIYGTDLPGGVWGFLAIHHRGYIYARESGDYTFTAPSNDDIVFLWLGDLAITGYTRANAIIEQGIVDVPKVYTASFVAGQYYPLRILWANGLGDNASGATFDFKVAAPNGDIILDTRADTASPYLVTHSCDEVTAPALPAR